MPTYEAFADQLDRLAAHEPGPYPVLSVYLNLQANDRGKDDFSAFIKNALSERLGTFPAEGPERISLDLDVEKLRTYLEGLDPAANGIALFMSSGSELFEAIQLSAPIDRHHLFIADRPQLYPLAQVLDQHPRYAAVVADTQSARLFVVAAGTLERTETIEGDKTKRHKAGGWSQSRYQRHVDDVRGRHLKEVAEVLTRTVRDEKIQSIVIGGDDVLTAHLKAELPKDVAERIVDVVRLDARAPEHAILQRALESLKQQDIQTDRERVDELLNAYRAGGLAVVGVEPVRRALELGQVHELVLTGLPPAGEPPDGGTGTGATDPSLASELGNELIVQARQSSASIRFIEDAALLASVGGVGAFLRFKL